VITGERFGICGVSKQLDKQFLEANHDSENGLPNYETCSSDDNEITDTSDDEIISADDIINITKRAEVIKVITETTAEKSGKRVWINSHAIRRKFTSVSIQSSDSDYEKLDGIDRNWCFASILYGLDGSNLPLCQRLHQGYSCLQGKAQSP